MTRIAAQGVERVVAFLDIGTNSIRFLLVRIEANGSYRVLTQQKEVVRLGEGEFIEGYLLPQAIERAVLVCAKFVNLAHAHDAQEIIAVATSATREAKNKEELIARLMTEAGLHVHTISGREEARLIYQGVSSGIHLGDKRALFIDIGGGSTEVILGDQRDYYYLDSLKLGAVRLSHSFFGDYAGPVSAEQYAQLQHYVHDVAIRAIQKVRDYRFEMTIGSSGTIENLADVAIRLTERRRRMREDVMTYAQATQAIEMLCALSVEERRRAPGLNPERADIVIGGAAILHTLMRDLGIGEIAISERGVQDGLLMDFLGRYDPAQATRTLSVRERSVIQFARACHFEEQHARNVARLALELFDSGLAAGLHAVGPQGRDLLYYAGLLHDIGAFVSYSSHQDHTYYLIQHADLIGFDQTEIAVIALTARHHRKRLPSRRDADFAALEEPMQDAVLVLSTLLRIAESLDRSHLGIVLRVQLRLNADGRALLELGCASQDCQLELWGLTEHDKIFKKVFGRDLQTIVV
jgi:exopolyphosphatase/guanosine-5'-triphosphate,3'-diphosphate pyrophosphatase